MATQTDIVNIGLRRIGANRISNLSSDSTKEAVAARDLFDEARRDVLSQHNWNFAIKRASLTASATAPTYGWDYAYPIPENFIRMISVHPIDSDSASVPYKLEFQSSDDRVLLTDSSTIYIRYVFDQQDMNLAPASFVDTLAWRLARDLAGAMSKSTAAAELAARAYERTLSKAKFSDAYEDYPENLPDGTWVTSRYPSSDGW